MEIHYNEVRKGFVEEKETHDMANATPIRVSGDMVIIPASEYNQLIEAQNRIDYLAMLDKRIDRLNHGEGVHKTLEELVGVHDA